MKEDYCRKEGESHICYRQIQFH